ncbi:MAG: hypothetical protein ACOCQ1_04495, partial [Halanaerobiaceae bacterium]
NDPAVKGRIEEAEELFNTEIEFLQERDIPSINMTRLVGGDSTYDLWFAQSRIGYYELVSEDAVLNMGEILPDEYYETLSVPEREAINILEFKGEKYGIGDTHYGMGVWDTGNIVMYYNENIIEEVGGPDPYELYENDEWTWEEAGKLFEATTRDTEGDGETDQWALRFFQPIPFSVANGASVTRENEEGEIVFSYDEPEAIEAMEQMQDWNDEGYVADDAEYGFHESFPMGEVAFYIHFVGKGEEFMDMEDEWTMIPLPKGPSADRYMYPHWSPETTLIPANAEQPEALAALRTFLFREEDVDLNTMLSRYVRNEKSGRTFQTIQEEWQGETRYLLENFGGSMVQDIVENDVVLGDDDPSAAMEEIKPVIQSEIDELFGQ